MAEQLGSPGSTSRGEHEQPPSDIHRRLEVSATVAGFDTATLLSVSRRQECATSGSDGDLVVIAVAGQVDMATVPLLRMALLDAIDSQPRVCCDLGEVTFFGADGVNVLVTARNLATRTGCRFSIRGVHRTVRRTLEITGLDGVLAIDA